MAGPYDIYPAVDADYAFPPEIRSKLASSAELKVLFDAKAPLASPIFTGIPQAPTPTVDDSSTQLATTAFVKTAAIAKYASAYLAAQQSQANGGILFPCNTTNTNDNTYFSFTSGGIQVRRAGFYHINFFAHYYKNATAGLLDIFIQRATGGTSSSVGTTTSNLGRASVMGVTETRMNGTRSVYLNQWDVIFVGTYTDQSTSTVYGNGTSEESGLQLTYAGG